VSECRIWEPSFDVLMEVLVSTTVLPALGEIEVFRSNARTTQRIVAMNVDGITQKESLVQPQPAGNCLNWVLGHLIWVYGNVLPLVNSNRLSPRTT